MAIIENRNLAWSDLSADVSERDVVRGCNCAQKQPSTAIPDAEYIECNLLNCDVSGLAVAPVDCLTVQKSLCYWLHPKLDLPVEPEDCPHVVNSYEADVDGHAAVTYEREDTTL